MNEYSFTLYHQSGVPVTFNVPPTPEHLRNINAAIQNALSTGWLVSEPKPGEGEKVIRVGGYVVGEYKDNKSGSFQPCVWLYPDNPVLEYRSVTVYPEDFKHLPFPVGKAEWDGAAPEASVARLKNKMHTWTAEVILTPKMKDGEVVVNENGKTVYEFLSVKTSEQSAEQTTTQQTNGHSPEPVTRTTAVNLITNDRCPECNAPAGKLHGTHCSKKTTVVGA